MLNGSSCGALISVHWRRHFDYFGALPGRYWRCLCTPAPATRSCYQSERRLPCRCCYSTYALLPCAYFGLHAPPCFHFLKTFHHMVLWMPWFQLEAAWTRAQGMGISPEVSRAKENLWRPQSSLGHKTLVWSQNHALCMSLYLTVCFFSKLSPRIVVWRSIMQFGSHLIWLLCLISYQ